LKSPVNRVQKSARQLIGLHTHYLEALKAVDWLRQEISDRRQALIPFMSRMHENTMHTCNHVLKLERKSKFNLARFKREHPDMYENYCDEDYKIKIEVETNE
jgi:hypothetical protein